MTQFLNLFGMIAVGLGIIGFCILLAVFGYRLDRKAKNPLKGLLDKEKDSKYIKGNSKSFFGKFIFFR